MTRNPDETAAADRAPVENRNAAVERLLEILRKSAVSPVPGEAILAGIASADASSDLPGDLRQVAVLTARIVDQSTAMLHARMDDIAHLEGEISSIEAAAKIGKPGKTIVVADDRALQSTRAALAEAKGRARRAERQMALMENSLSWRITRPLRAVRRMMLGQG